MQICNVLMVSYDLTVDFKITKKKQKIRAVVEYEG